MPFRTSFPGGRLSDLKVAHLLFRIFVLVQRSRAAAFCRYEAGLMVFYAQEPGVDRGFMPAQWSGKCVYDVTKLYEWIFKVETPKRLFLSQCISISLLRLYTFFSRSQSVIIFSLKMSGSTVSAAWGPVLILSTIIFYCRSLCQWSLGMDTKCAPSSCGRRG